jgi:hypothetical protein
MRMKRPVPEHYIVPTVRSSLAVETLKQQVRTEIGTLADHHQRLIWPGKQREPGTSVRKYVISNALLFPDFSFCKRLIARRKEYAVYINPKSKMKAG